MQTTNIILRVIRDKGNKRKFENHHIENFPKYESLDEIKREFLSSYGNELNGECLNKTIDVGYIGYSNKKHRILSDEDLKTAFESGREHSKKCPVFFMVEAEQESESEKEGKHISWSSQRQMPRAMQHAAFLVQTANVFSI